MNYEKKYKEAMDRMELCVRSGLKITPEYIFPELAESEQKPNGGIVREDFTQGDGWYKVNLDYLSKAQVEEIEQLVEKWNPKEVSEDEKIKKAILIYLDWLDGKKDYLPKGDYTIKDMILWLEKQGQVKESTISQHENRTCEENGNSLTYEDEKVRKELIDAIQGLWDNDALPMPLSVKRKAKWLAWLEKQGEKHPDPYNGISFEYNGHIWGMCARDNGVDISCDKHLIKHLEKQGEQKPADKVEPKFKVGDKIYLKPEYRMPDDDTPIANTVKEIKRIDDKHYRFDGSYIFIEDQDKYELVEQKQEENKGNIGGISANWSEEDEQRLNSCLNILQPKTFVGNTETINTKWLKSLKDRVQPKQEWSEEDKAFLDDILCKLEHDLILNKDEKDWLKSLRPQNRWKPSDVQMSLLQAIINEPKNAASESCQIVLREVLEQLKKLKEE